MFSRVHALIASIILGFISFPDAFAYERDAEQTPSYEELEVLLKTEGLEGWIHASNPTAGLYVFTWRDPKNFFNNRQFPMISAKADIRESMRKLNRHDKVWVRGEYVQNEAPQKHIQVFELAVRDAYKSEWSKDYGEGFPEELTDLKSIHATVHAIAGNGSIMVIEYKNSIMPVFVPDPKYTKDLFRNDKIEMAFVIRKHPTRPRHLELDVEAPVPLRLIDRLVEQHEKNATITGSLVRFPKSPQVSFDVFAIEVKDSEGLTRLYTLVNFDSPEVFMDIRKKMGTIWDLYKSEATYARNKWVNRNIKIEATGSLNVQSPDQANPQVLLSSAKDISAYHMVQQWKKLEELE